MPSGKAFICLKGCVPFEWITYIIKTPGMGLRSKKCFNLYIPKFDDLDNS